MMLRTKQVAPVCQCARSFLLASSRSGNQDGTTSSCSDHENSASVKHSRSSQSYFSTSAATLVSSASESFPVQPKVLSANCKAGKDAILSPKPHIQTASNAEQSDETPLHGPSHDFGQYMISSQTLKQQIAGAGLVTAGFISDIISYIPGLGSNGFNIVPQNFMVDPGRYNVKSLKSKSEKTSSPCKEQVTSSISKRPTSPVHIQGDRYVQEKTYLRKPQPNLATNRTIIDPENHTIRSAPASNRQYQRKCIPQGSKFHRQRGHSAPRSFKGKESASGRIVTNKVQGGSYADKSSMVPSESVRINIVAREPSYLNSTGKDAENVHNILRCLKWWGPAAESALAHMELNAYQANQQLKLLKDHSVALGFFYWLKRQPGYKHDGHCYTTMIGILGNSQQFTTMNRLLNEMVRDGYEPNVVTYNRLIHSYGRANLLSESISLFYKMQEAGCQPDRVTYCTLIDIHAKAGLFDVAMDMYSRMVKAGLTPDTFTYGVIINCLGKAGHLAPAYKLFCEMVANGCVPNLITYNIMITLQAKAKNFSTALRLYREMQSAGFHPDKVTYNIIMEVLGHCGYLDEVESVFAEMKRQNLVPDEPAYGLLIDLWGKAGNIAKAQGWYQSMLDAGLKPNVPTCNSLLSAFLRVDLFADAYKMLQSMMRLGLNPSCQTYTLLLSSCTVDTLSHEAMSSCSELLSMTGHPAHIFLSTMPNAGPDGRNVREHVAKFLNVMNSEDRESKRGVVDAVIDFLHKFELKDEAASVWDVAAHNVYPHAVKEKLKSYWLINLHVMSNGTAVVALSRTLASFRKQMLACDGVAPNRIDIVTGWGRRSKITGASLVRQSVYDLLQLFRFPIAAENGNFGCFVGYGEPLSKWLNKSYVERMHLM